MSMGGKLTRKIRIERTEVWWCLKKLAFILLHFLQRFGHIEEDALSMLRRCYD